METDRWHRRGKSSFEIDQFDLMCDGQIWQKFNEVFVEGLGWSLIRSGPGINPNYKIIKPGEEDKHWLWGYPLKRSDMTQQMRSILRTTPPPPELISSSD